MNKNAPAMVEEKLQPRSGSKRHGEQPFSEAGVEGIRQFLRRSIFGENEYKTIAHGLLATIDVQAAQLAAITGERDAWKQQYECQAKGTAAVYKRAERFEAERDEARRWIGRLRTVVMELWDHKSLLTPGTIERVTTVLNATISIASENEVNDG